MPAIRRWFGFLVVVAALHMIEQLLVGLDELYMIRRVLRVYFGRFSSTDFAIVLLVTVVVLLVLTLIYGVLLGGRPLLWVMGLFVFISITEVHHVVESVTERRYVPGTVTAILWIFVGVRLGQAVARQARSASAPNG